MMLYDFKVGLTAHESHKRLSDAFNEEVPSLKTIQRWFHKFSDGDFEIEDDPRSGRPKTATSDEKVMEVRELVSSDPHITYEKIEEETGIGSQAVSTILHDILKMKKICARWVPHYLTDDQKKSQSRILRRYVGKIQKRNLRFGQGDFDWRRNVVAQLYTSQKGTK